MLYEGLHCKVTCNFSLAFYDFARSKQRTKKIVNSVSCRMTHETNRILNKVCLFVSRVGMGSTVRDPCLPDELNPYFAEFSKCRYCHIHKLPCGRRYLWHRTSTIPYLLHLTLASDHWLARNVGCLKMPVWLSHLCGVTCWVFDLLGCSASDTSPLERMVSLVGLVEFNEREYWIQRWLVSIVMSSCWFYCLRGH